MSIHSRYWSVGTVGIYIGIWIIILLCCILEAYVEEISVGNSKKISSNKVTFWICFLSVLLIGIFRSEQLGVDWGNYLMHYNNYGTRSVASILSAWKTTDIGYFLLGKFIYRLGCSYHTFRAILYALNIAIVGKTIYDNSRFPALSFMAFVGMGMFHVLFGLLRMSCAICICFYSYKYAKNNELGKFVITVLVAATFHKTALAFLLLYPLVNMDFSGIELKRKLFYIAVCMFAGFVFIPYIYVLYLRNDYSEAITSNGGFSLLLMYIALAAVYSWVSRSIFADREDKSVGYVNYKIMKAERVTWSCVYVQIEALFFSLLTRLTKYFAVGYALGLPELMEEEKYRRLVLGIYIPLFTILYLVQLDSSIVPYVSVFD